MSVRFLEKFDSRVCGIPCQIGVVSWYPVVAAIIRADPNDSHPAEGGVSFVLLDTKGRRALWLERKLTESAREKIAEECLSAMMETINY